MLEIDGRKRRQPKRSKVSDSVLLEIGHPERLVFAVINFGNVHRAIELITPIEEFEGRPWPVNSIIPKAVCAQNIVLHVCETGAV